jgi:hypothetical protein
VLWAKIHFYWSACLLSFNTDGLTGCRCDKSRLYSVFKQFLAATPVAIFTRTLDHGQRCLHKIRCVDSRDESFYSVPWQLEAERRLIDIEYAVEIDKVHDLIRHKQIIPVEIDFQAETFVTL